MSEQEQRRAELMKRYGLPEPIAAYTALRLASHALEGIPDDVVPADVHASVYRDQEAADAWLAANREMYGHQCLARFALPDGRVVGILDLRPALARSARQGREAPPT